MTARLERTAPPGKTANARRTLSLTPAQLERFRAPFALRCGALLIDYTLPVCILAFSTLFARLVGGGTRLAGDTAENIGLLLAFGAACLNFFLFAGTRGQTLGKWATGLHLERTDGAHPGIGHAILRHLIGYPLSLAIFGIGFFLAAFDSQGRALHDRIAGTLVLRDTEQRARRVR
ncbi:MAG: RDD family protein [Pyrinomonadaceae bacterium]